MAQVGTYNTAILSGGVCKENAFAVCVCVCVKILSLKHNISPHWGLNPGPSVYRTDALPLSYRGICLCGGNKYHRHVSVDSFRIGGEAMFDGAAKEQEMLRGRRGAPSGGEAQWPFQPLNHASRAPFIRKCSENARRSPRGERPYDHFHT